MLKKILRACVQVGLLSFCLGSAAVAAVTRYPAPAPTRLSSDYTILADGLPIDVYAATTHLRDGKYSYAYFDFSDSVIVSIKSKFPFTKCRVLPLSSGVVPRVTGDSLEFTLDKPQDLSIEPNGPNSPLLLFTNPPEENVPNPGDPNVIYFGPGIHQAGLIKLTSHQTLYLAGGSVVKGAIESHGVDIAIGGRGILLGDDWPWLNGPAKYMAGFEECHNVTIRDVILQGSWGWTIVLKGCRSVTIDHVRICGSRVENDDGIDVCNSVDVEIRRCFIRTDDDCIAVKGLHRALPSERLTVEDSTFWTDRANVFRIGFESEAAGSMRSIQGRNLDVLHYAGTGARGEYWSTWVWYIQPFDEIPMEDMEFENIRIDNHDGVRNLIKIQPMIRTESDWDRKLPGKYVKNVLFKNVFLTGSTAAVAPGAIYVSGADARHVVEGIRFENVTRYGRCVREHAPSVKIGKHATDIQFLCPEGDVNTTAKP
jgi:Glycosyl hydrolases family 28